MTHKHFDSLSALVQFTDKNNRKNSRARNNVESCGDGWAGYDKWDVILNKASRGGEDTYVSDAQRIMEKLESVFEAYRNLFVPSVAGAYPCVPDAIIGLPEPMRRKISLATDNAPISIWIPTVCSAGIKIPTLVKRGTALLAFAMALVASGRAVELSVVSFGNGNQDKDNEVVVSATIPTSPLSLSEACFALCNLGFTRAAMYSAKYILDSGCAGRWPQAYNALGEAGYCADLAKRKGITFVAPPAHLKDAEMIDADPVAWLQTRLGDIKRFLAPE